MSNKYERASEILANLKLTSDNVELSDCYFLCANKNHIESMLSHDHQVIWGRRGTGKTTLLKAFTYYINSIQQDKPNNLAIYIVMAKIIPTEEEISQLTGDGSKLAVFVFYKMICSICDAIEKIYNLRSLVIDDEADTAFLDTYYMLDDYLKTYRAYSQGGEISIENLRSTELKNGIGREITGKIDLQEKVFGFLASFFGTKTRTRSTKSSFSVSGQLQIALDSEVIARCLSRMLDSLGIELAYICLDEYSEMDKVSNHPIQAKVAQLIKQVFFKNPKYSVKIATVWSRSKLHERGGNWVEGIEYQQDIFAGTDLDIMFMEQNSDVVQYFKELLVNTYLMGKEIDDAEKRALSDYIETDIFTEPGLRHLICGAQGVSRTFVILAKSYLRQFVKEKNGPVKLGKVYEAIKLHYFEDVRNKIPYFTLYREIDKYLSKHLRRYFLISRSDYERCKSQIKYLASRGVFMQMPGHLTDRSIRDDYKLFIVHYGNYLDALQTASFKRSRKTLEDDAKLEENGRLIPEYSSEMCENPEAFTVIIPDDVEKETYCKACSKIIFGKEDGGHITCPSCGNTIIRFEEFVDAIGL